MDVCPISKQGYSRRLQNFSKNPILALTHLVSRHGDLWSELFTLHSTNLSSTTNYHSISNLVQSLLCPTEQDNLFPISSKMTESLWPSEQTSSPPTAAGVHRFCCFFSKWAEQSCHQIPTEAVMAACTMRLTLPSAEGISNLEGFSFFFCPHSTW